MSTYSSAANMDVFVNSIDELTKCVFFDDIGQDYEMAVSEQELQKSAWISSLLANSSEDQHRKKALSFAVLYYVTKREGEREPLYRRYLYTILSRLGNIPTANALADQFEGEGIEIAENGSLLDAEIFFTEEFYRFDDETVFTDFQKRVWENLEDDYFVFSGPTSSGKSFLLQTFVEYKIEEVDNFQGIYLVPSKALISEVSTKFKKELGDEIDVRTSAYIDELGDSYLLVLTPERCLQLFDYEDDDDVDFDLIFLDEIQELESESRGPLFEDVLGNLEDMWGSAQILAAGPNISNPKEILGEIIKGDTSDVKSMYNPAVHIECNFTFYKRSSNIEVTIESPSGSELTETIDRPTGLSYSTIGGPMKKAVRRFDEEFGGSGQTLVYSPKTQTAESLAEGLAESRNKQQISPRRKSLIDYLERTIHEEYTLAESLKNGVAFHHSGVPQVAREEIEELFDEEDIEAIASTSTLLQGVNLPAEKMYILDPSKGKNQILSDHEFENLLGRVGRVGEKMYGTIYYLDREDEEWADDRIGKTTSKEVTSATKKAISENREELIENIDNKDINRMDNKGLKYTITLLRNRHIRDNKSVSNYLSKKDVPQSEINEIQTRLEPLLADLEIPKEILRKNPTVDPLLQNQLYKNITANHQMWEINPRNLRNDFFRVTRQLNSIFKFAEDPENGIEDIGDSELRAYNFIRSLFQGYHWVDGKDYKQMISLRRQALREKKVSTSIKNVMKITRHDVQYLFVKYYKILCDILSSIDDYDNAFMLNFDKRLERGSINPSHLKMMDMGIDRSIAIEYTPPDDEDVEEYLESMVSSMEPLYQRHLQNAGVNVNNTNDE
ncbi:DEAD/DEAH box helicase [Natrialbaceae archaeon A-CW3]